MSLTVVLASFTIAASVVVLWWAAASSRTPERAAARNLGAGAASDLRDLALQADMGERAVGPAMRAAARRARRLSPAGRLDALEHRIVLAGMGSRWPLERVLAVKLLLALGLGTFATVVWFADPGVLRTVAVGVAVIGGFFVPDLILHGRAAERQKIMRRELPDTLDQITISVQAGLGFESAMARAGRSGRGPLAGELIRTMQEIQVGVSRDQALRNLTQRSDVPELRQFVLAAIQGERYGIPIARIFNVQSAELRTKRRQRAEQAAMKIPVKVLFPLIFCILPALMIVVLGPAVIRVAEAMF